MENKADMPRQNQFVFDVLSGRYKELKKEAKQYTTDNKENKVARKR